MGVILRGQQQVENGNVWSMHTHTHTHRVLGHLLGQMFGQQWLSVCLSLTAEGKKIKAGLSHLLIQAVGESEKLVWKIPRAWYKPWFHFLIYADLYIHLQKQPPKNALAVKPEAEKHHVPVLYLFHDHSTWNTSDRKVFEDGNESRKGTTRELFIYLKINK